MSSTPLPEMQFLNLKTLSRKQRAAIGATTVILISIVVAMLLHREKNDGLPAAETPADTGALRVALLPTLETLPFYVAALDGTYDSLGLALRIADTDAQFDADTALYGHSAHLASTDLVRLQYQARRGQQAVVLMGLQGAWGVASAPARRAGGVKDLQDGLLGIARFSSSDLLSADALAKAELDYDGMLRAQANALPVRANMVVQGQTEAAVLPEPWLSWAVSKKCKPQPS